jgi:hypothetical protein
LHERIKNHPYRLSGQISHLKSYKELLWKLSEVFYRVVKSTKFKMATNMVHDFNGAVNNLGRENYKNQILNDLHVENCLSVVHEFIDNETISKFYTLYFGSAKVFSGLGPQRTYIWNEEIQKYYLYCPEEKMDALFEGIRKHQEWLKSLKENPVWANDVEYWNSFMEEVKKYNTKEKL